MMSRGASSVRWVVPIAVVLFGSSPAWGQETGSAAPSANCPKGAGLIVLVGQEDLYLNRAARRASIGDSILKSIVASALTGGTYLMGFYSGYDFGSLVPAPRSLTSGFQPTDVAESLVRELSSTPAAADYELLRSTTRAEDVDEAIWSTACVRVVVVNAQYALERTREGVQLSLVTQVLDVPAKRRTEPSLVAALEYRSGPMLVRESNDPAVLAAALAKLLADERSKLVADFHEASVETAGMLAHKLQAGESDAPVATLAKSASRRQLLCDDCKRSDRVLAEKSGRLWVQPEDEPAVVRSLPLESQVPMSK